MEAHDPNARKVRWGILGTARIARKNWKALFNSGNSTVVAVASRQWERARQFIAECQAEAPMATLPRAFGNYQELLDLKEVDAVYIPLPTTVRKEWVLRAAEAGKHIVCEKPCAATVPDLDEMLAACRQHRVQFMDGVMFMHSARLTKLRQVLDDGDSVGAIRRIDSAFSFCAAPDFFADNIRTNHALEPFGCLGDLGWSCIRLALWAMNWQMPREVVGQMLSAQDRGGEGPVPTEFSGEMRFGNGVSAGFYCSFLAHNQQWAVISGERGYVEEADFVVPFDGPEASFDIRKADFQTRGCDFKMEPRVRRVGVAEFSHGRPNAQESSLFRTFSEQVRAGRLEPFWPEVARQTQLVMCACMESARLGGRIQPLG